MRFSRSIVFPALLLAFAGWVVYLAGLAATQRNCREVFWNTGSNVIRDTDGLFGVYTFSANVLSCSQMYRYHWFIMAFEIVTIIGAIIAAAVPDGIPRTRGFWVGMFAICTLLYMQMSEAWLAATNTDITTTGVNQATFRATAAGAIITVVGNVAVLFAIGTDWDWDRPRAGKEPAGTTTPPGATAV